MFFAFYDRCSSFFYFSVFLSEVHTFPSLNFAFFSFFLLLFSFSPQDGSNKPNSSPLDYKSVYRWAPDKILEETSLLCEYSDL